MVSICKRGKVWGLIETKQSLGCLFVKEVKFREI